MMRVKQADQTRCSLPFVLPVSGVVRRGVGGETRSERAKVGPYFFLAQTLMKAVKVHFVTLLS
jgi:hypothetical protein